MLWPVRVADSFWAIMCTMLICIGGFAGSGRNRIAKELAKVLGFHNFNLTRLKKQPLIRHEHRITHEKLFSYSDELLLRIFRSAVSNFQQLSKMYPDMIVADYFTREIPREFLFNEAEKYFGPPLIIWMDSTEEESIVRLNELYGTKQNILKNKRLIQSNIRARFQPFTRSVHNIRYINNPAAIDEALTLVREHLK